MSGPKPPATSTLPSRSRVAAKPTRLVCMLGALPQLSPNGEARNTWVSVTACGPSEPVAISTRPSASSITICASPREGGPAGVSTPDHRPRAAGDESGVLGGGARFSPWGHTRGELSPLAVDRRKKGDGLGGRPRARTFLATPFPHHRARRTAKKGRGKNDPSPPLRVKERKLLLVESH